MNNDEKKGIKITVDTVNSPTVALNNLVNQLDEAFKQRDESEKTNTQGNDD